MIADKKGWLIVGAGAIGLLWYSKLAEKKIPVTLLHRANSPLKTLTLMSDKQSHHYPLSELSVNFESHTANTVTEQQLEFTQVLFCTKSFDLVSAYLTNKHYFSDDATLVTLCNGMGAQQTLNQFKTDQQKLFIGTTNEGALKLDTNVISKTGDGDIFVGALNSNEQPPEPFTPYACSNIRQKLLTKLAINAVINPLTAFFNINNGQLLEPDYLPYYQACRDEVCLFLRSNLNEQQALMNIIDSVAYKTGKNRSSMLQDFSLNKQTEIQFISGYLISEATKVNHTLPIQALLLDFVENKQSQSTQLLKFNNFLHNS